MLAVVGLAIGVPAWIHRHNSKPASHDTLNGIVIGPTPPVAVADSASTDLATRILVLNPATTIEEPDALVTGGFRDLPTFLSQFAAADRPLQQQRLTDEGFEGSELHSWQLKGTSGERFLVDLTRFTTAAGASRHLSGFVEGGLHPGSDNQQISPAIPGGLAFLRTSSVDSSLREVLEYQTLGRYFCLIIVRGPPSTVSDSALESAGAVLARAQRLRMTSNASAPST